MAKTEIYQIAQPMDLVDLTDQLNRILNRISDRVDKLEGVRGTTTIQEAIVLEDEEGNVVHGFNAEDQA